MKIRYGFVSNSSSSSFMISKHEISAYQLCQIVDYQTECEKYNMSCNSEDAWSIDTNSPNVKGTTWMDNFDMRKFLQHIGIKSDVIKWDY